jgi:hypothetical protein
MDFQLSAALASVLGLRQGDDFSRRIDLPGLAPRLAGPLGNRASAAATLLAEVSGTETCDGLVRDIGAFLPFDSAVRDLATTGHLMKLLARRTAYQKLRDWRIVGLPNEIFDRVSWQERNDFFRPGVCHTFDGDLFRIPEVVEMLAREGRIIGMSK